VTVLKTYHHTDRNCSLTLHQSHWPLPPCWSSCRSF